MKSRALPADLRELIVQRLGQAFADRYRRELEARRNHEAKGSTAQNAREEKSPVRT